MYDPETYRDKLELSHVLRQPVIQEIVDTLGLPNGGKGLDAGCGTGFYTLMLAGATGPDGHVTGLDIEERFLDRGRSLASASAMGDRVAFVDGDLKELPFSDNSFDWAFSMDLVGYLKIGHPVPLLRELARVVRPGGAVFILNWSSQMLLPGYPLLEAQLNATSAGIAPFEPGTQPGLHSLRALEWFQQAGLAGTGAQTFVGSITPPLSSKTRRALIDLFEMRWGEAGPELPEKAQSEYRRLCSAGSPDLILNLPGYYGFFTYTLFKGRVV